ncbi:MAG: hypothetical protein IPJ03_03420 [Ignavibacteriales bacterium]|nr:hypothetical protein [Ignavibacteriales bacterium]
MEENNKLIDLEIKRMEFWREALAKVDPLLGYFSQKMIKHDAPIAKYSIIGVALIILLVLLLTFWLLLNDKLGNSAFTFVVGTIVGYLIAMTKIIFKSVQ